jgi:multiple sugar transport system permease protein
LKTIKNFKKKYLESEKISILLSILPFAIFTLAVIFYPLINIFFHSFTNWTIKETVFTGFENYIKLVSSGTFLDLLKNNLIVSLSIPIQVIISLIISYILYSEIWGWKFFRILFYIPSILSIVVIGYLFRTFFASDGILNNILKTLNLDFLTINWFDKTATSFIVVILALIWSQYGMATFIFLSGMSAIDSSVLESAKIDGASWWGRFTKIVIPMIIGTIEFYLVILTIGIFTSVFSFIYSITYGGPGFSTTTIEYMIYLKAFKSNSLGQSSALAVMLFIIVLIITIIIIRIFRKIGKWE